jgi:hypothetical protein
MLTRGLAKQIQQSIGLFSRVSKKALSTPGMEPHMDVIEEVCLAPAHFSGPVFLKSPDHLSPLTKNLATCGESSTNNNSSQNPSRSRHSEEESPRPSRLFSWQYIRNQSRTLQATTPPRGQAGTQMLDAEGRTGVMAQIE